MVNNYRSLGFVRVRGLFFALLMAGSFLVPSVSHACCWACPESDCDQAEDYIDDQHDLIVDRVEGEFDEDLEQFERWMIELFEVQFVPAMAAMTTQMNAVAMKYTEIIGMFLDAQIQMDTHRLMRKLQVVAHKDYHTSEEFCWFGTNVRSLAASEAIGHSNSLTLSKVSLVRQLGNSGVAGAGDVRDDYKARWGQFVDTYCDPGDNNRQGAGTGLDLACDHDGAGAPTDVGASEHARVNRDVDYTRLIDSPRTLDIDLTNDSLDTENLFIVNEPGDEEDVLALSKNLYGHKVLSRGLSRLSIQSSNAQKLYLALRSIAAKRGVAQASFNAIVGLKSSGTAHEDPFGVILHPSGTVAPLPLAATIRSAKDTRRYLAAIMHQLLPADTSNTGANIFDLIGYSPSYYSQLEILAKRIYQNPDFYANLYDTPANVARKKVAMKAIELMVDRAIYESQLRREMSVSVLLSSKLRPLHRSANDGLAVSHGE